MYKPDDYFVGGGTPDQSGCTKGDPDEDGNVTWKIGSPDLTPGDLRQAHNVDNLLPVKIAADSVNEWSIQTDEHYWMPHTIKVSPNESYLLHGQLSPESRTVLYNEWTTVYRALESKVFDYFLDWGLASLPSATVACCGQVVVPLSVSIDRLDGHNA